MPKFSLMTALKPSIPSALLSIFVSAFVAAGWGFITPKKSMENLQGQLTEQKSRVDSLGVKIDSTTILLQAIARGQCIDRSQRETALMGLDCKKLLHQ